MEKDTLPGDFQQCAEYVSGGNIPNIDSKEQLKLYGLFKQATVGPCNTKRPSSLLDPKGCHKWDAWNGVKHLSKEEAMKQYVKEVTSLSPEWMKDKKPASHGSLGGKTFSRPVKEEEVKKDSWSLIDLVKDKKKTKEALKMISSGSSVNITDDEQRSPLHWAADGEQLELVQRLIKAGANVNAQDSSGQTPLHYAVTLDFKDIVLELVKNGADITIKDEDNESPLDMQQDLEELVEEIKTEQILQKELQKRSKYFTTLAYVVGGIILTTITLLVWKKKR
eukprot:TRINITY_DN640_c0_g1_i1.p1 TRINITY_DN640_c0_g1~~TRINITY_DN640_c0_g1_i1.p1  ORF type:complete len:279 (+),score=68.19 TRINITY_DN640_c0_g1_i1:54-890(+)